MVPPADGDNLGIIPSQFMIGLEFIFEPKKKKAELALFTEKEGFFYIFLLLLFYLFIFCLTPGEDTRQERRNVESWRGLLRSRY